VPSKQLKMKISVFLTGVLYHKGGSVLPSSLKELQLKAAYGNNSMHCSTKII